jgi:urocanate hydratase
MRNIKEYRDFCINESNELFFSRHLGSSGRTYQNRAKNYYDLPEDATVLQKTQNFFQRMEDILNNIAREGQSTVKQNRAIRGGNLNTGYETLFGIPSVVPAVLKRVFGPTKFEFTRKSQSKEDIDIEFMRHTNEDFVRNELPNIQTEQQLEQNIAELYKKAQVNKGDVPVLDDIGMNRAYLYYTRKKNPNQNIFKPNN